MATQTVLACRKMSQILKWTAEGRSRGWMSRKLRVTRERIRQILKEGEARFS